MTYLLTAAAGGIVLIALLVVLTKKRNHPASPHPMAVQKPAADEPTPARSAIAAKGQERRAASRIPPA